MNGGQGGSLDQLYSRYAKTTGDKSFGLQDLQNEFGLLNNKLREQAAVRGLATKGDAHTGYKFPELDYEGTNLGPVNGDERTEASPNTGPSFDEKFLARQIPSDIGEDGLHWSKERNLPFFISPETGDITYTYPKFLNDPRYRKSLERMKQEMESKGLASSLLPK